MNDDILIRRTPDPSAAAELSHRAEWDARPTDAPLYTMGAKVTIQKNWQELIKPNKIEFSSKGKTLTQLVAEPLERGFGLTLGNALRRVLLSSLRGAAGVELLRPVREDRLRMWPVSRRANKPGKGDDDPSLIDEVTAEWRTAQHRVV